MKIGPSDLKKLNYFGVNTLKNFLTQLINYTFDIKTITNSTKVYIFVIY